MQLATAILVLAGAVVASAILLAIIGVKAMAKIDDLNAALTAQDTAIQALTTAVNNTAPNLDPAIAHVNANNAQIDALTAQLNEGAPPPGP